MAVVTTSAPAVDRRRLRWWLVGTLAVVGAVYGPVLGLRFAGDDFIILHPVRQNGGLKHPAAYFGVSFFGYYRPLAFLSQALDWQLWGEQPIAFHLTSLLLHALNTLLVFALARRLLGSLEAIIASQLFALHPSNHEAVFWMAARFDLLATCLVLAGRLALTATPDAGMRPAAGPPVAATNRLLYAVATLCFALALLSKESAFAFPLIAVSADTFLLGRSGRSALLRLAPLLLVIAAYTAIRTGGGGEEASQGMAHLAKGLLMGGALAAVV